MTVTTLFSGALTANIEQQIGPFAASALWFESPLVGDYFTNGWEYLEVAGAIAIETTVAPTTPPLLVRRLWVDSPTNFDTKHLYPLPQLLPDQQFILYLSPSEDMDLFVIGVS